MLNAQHRFDKRYIECVNEQMTDLKPFGDVPTKLILDIKRSFVATRTFIQALSVGKDVVKNIMEVYISIKYILYGMESAIACVENLFLSKINK